MLLFNKNVIEVKFMEILNKNIFGLNFQAEEINTKGLPVFMTAQRSFFRMSYKEIDFLCVQLSKEERFGIVALEKQLSFLSNKYGKIGRAHV